MASTVISNNLKDGDYLPNDFVLSADFGFGCAGGNRSPHLKWSGARQGMQGFAVTCHDPDADRRHYCCAVRLHSAIGRSCPCRTCPLIFPHRVAFESGICVMGTAQDHRKCAEECVAMARLSDDDGDKALWLTLAQSWVRLAEHVARAETGAPPPADDGALEVQPSEGA